ncbi:MAG: hypothetical protein GTO45_07785, partial [Candidatus Aminicenantes bacterium]|nr:hypothetical protein [Candidatus Aminicenantes bacterium]NIM78730.1 hypothetical protein [Candidatus Aminicenantes bacterium]NIN17985.1 hypothetical protein [Candidatus Aminicenantes bacterium]NIN41885.1 hypothetical protein [Candidatus Aminicenantes bacterium]NIN84640.1 hypothetical protein [Candidatus Aminicenantes bacterium]
DSTEKYRDLSENMQLVGNILFEKAKVEANPSRSINKLKNARIAFEKSNSFAESTQYLKAVCDNYSNLLSIAIMLAEDSEVDRLYNILKMLLTDKMNIPERLERIELIVRMYREARQLYRNNI